MIPTPHAHSPQPPCTVYRVPSLLPVITRKQHDCGKVTGSPSWSPYFKSPEKKNECGASCVLCCHSWNPDLYPGSSSTRLPTSLTPSPWPCSPQRNWSGQTRRREGSIMVAFPPLLARDGVGLNTNFTYPPQAPPTFTVICAYPLSGQYGPGTRYLYYGLVAVCIFARKHEWLREPCLAAALLFPALSSIHAIIMACYSDSGKYHSISLYYSH